jgi:hypothetical protein
VQKIFIFVPAFGQTITATTFLTTCALQQHLFAKGIGGGISTLSFPDIAELRAMALTIWYDTLKDSSHILFIDADMGFAPDLVTDMMLFDEPLVGAIYPQRKVPLSWAGSGTGAASTERRGNFMLVEGVGMGCTLIRRDLVDRMVAQFPELDDKRLSLHPAGETLRAAGTTRLLRLFEKMDIPERGLISEDLSFCIRAKQCGVQTWASIGHRMSHVGPYDYGARYLDVVEAAAAQQQQVMLPQNMGGSTVVEAVQVVQPTGLPIQEVPTAEPVPVEQLQAAE